MENQYITKVITTTPEVYEEIKLWIKFYETCPTISPTAPRAPREYQFRDYVLSPSYTPSEETEDEDEDEEEYEQEITSCSPSYEVEDEYEDETNISVITIEDDDDDSIYQQATMECEDYGQDDDIIILEDEEYSFQPRFNHKLPIHHTIE